MKQRHYGIDALRLVCMFMIIVIHIFTKGGALSPEKMSAKDLASYAMIFPFYSALGCYALISGYMMFASKYSYRKLLPLWVQVVFYSAGITILFRLLVPGSVDSKTFIESFFPVTTKQWWYISAYFAMYLLAPLMNRAVEYTPRKAMTYSLAFLLLFVCIFSNLLRSDAFNVLSGHSSAWVCIMYLLGAYLRKYDCFATKKAKPFVLTFLGVNTFVFLMRIVLHYLSETPLAFLTETNLFAGLTAPNCVVSSVCLFMIFLKYKPGAFVSKLVDFLSPAALGIYLIHVHPLIFELPFRSFAVGFLQNSLPVYLIKVFICTLIIFIGSLLIDLLRIQLFKLLRVQKLCNCVCDKAKAFADKLYQKCVEK